MELSAAMKMIEGLNWSTGMLHVGMLYGLLTSLLELSKTEQVLS